MCRWERLVEPDLSEIPRDRPVVVYCHSGVRSLEVAKMLAEQGYEGRAES